MQLYKNIVLAINYELVIGFRWYLYIWLTSMSRMRLSPYSELIIYILDFHSTCISRYHYVNAHRYLYIRLQVGWIRKNFRVGEKIDRSWWDLLRINYIAGNMLALIKRILPYPPPKARFFLLLYPAFIYSRLTCKFSAFP